MTHVYARQVLNGLEVSDGDINLNIDRHGRVLSWGNSFHPGSEIPLIDYSRDTNAACTEVLQAANDHHAAFQKTKRPTGAFAMAKQALSAWMNGEIEEWVEVDEHTKENIRKNKQHVDNHVVLCERMPNKGMKSPTEVLAHFLPHLSDNAIALDPTLLLSTPEHSLKPKKAHAEPPTERISGEVLRAFDVVADIPARLMWTQTSDGLPVLVYKFEIEMKDNWYEAYADVRTGQIQRIVDWASDASDHHHVDARAGKQKPIPNPPSGDHASYDVFPWGVNDPTTGKHQVVKDPWDSVASPLGWHTFPTKANPWPQAKFAGSFKHGGNTTVASTVGNNVLAHEDWEGRNNFLDNHRPVAKDMNFKYDYGEPDGLAPKEYVDFAITQLFYTCNAYHDLLHRLGFDEVSGNFQMYNFEKGGRGGDPVIANAQDGSGYNNANFMTPPDGQAPRMRMYIWDTATPYRDGDLEAGIVIHEYSHGLSTRLTGGPANSGCLGWGEAGGMGEGWGDAIATLIRQVHERKKNDDSDVYPMGAWAANQKTGIRNYIYSTNTTDNPSTYKTLDKPGYWGVHAIGEVWAEFLFVLNQRLIEKYGFSDTLFPPEDPSKPNDYYTKTLEVDEKGKPKPLVPKHGNTLALQLIVSAMKLQPCRPSFFEARDAIVQADEILTGGDNACIIWKAFAERGLGSDAKIVGQTPWGGGVREDGHKVPPAACK